MTLVDKYNEMTKGITYRGVRFSLFNENIWDYLPKKHGVRPCIHNTQKLHLDGDIATIMGKLLNLFGEPNSCGDGYKVSREYTLAAYIIEHDYTIYFTVYDWKGWGVSIGMEHELIRDETHERLVEWAFVGLVNQHEELSDFADVITYDGHQEYGVINGKPYGSECIPEDEEEDW